MELYVEISHKSDLSFLLRSTKCDKILSFDIRRVKKHPEKDVNGLKVIR